MMEIIGKLLFIPFPTAYLFTESYERLSSSMRNTLDLQRQIETEIEMVNLQ